jgi:hypothetical protein
MPVPFGFGVGDFIAVGGLIAKVVQELKEVRSLLSQHQSILLANITSRMEKHQANISRSFSI